ncbi:MAG: HU family DNA-binding protein, partial [Bacteroidales bacterium]|nr:HU family DNA-binding protein [Bacteroidales bacterium]
MSSKLNMQDIIDLLVAKNDISKEEAESFIVELFNLIEKGLSTDELTKIKDLGTFKLTHIQKRESIDVNTQEKIIIPPHRRVTFVPAQLLKSLVNKPFAHFETTPLNEGVFMEGISHIAFTDDATEEDRYEDDEEKAEDSEPIEEDAIAKKEPDITFKEKEEDSIDNQNESEDFIGPETVLVTTSDDTDTPESIVDEFTINSPIEDNTNEAINQKSSIAVSKNPSVDMVSAKRKPKRVIILWLNVAIVLLVIFSLGFAYNYYTSNNSSDLVVKVSETAKPQEDVSVANTEIPLDEVEDVVDSVESAEALPRKTAKMSPGRTLRLIALDKLGDREFWVYIYLINKDKIENPNVVPIGLVLELPHENEYPMNASNPVD